MKTFLEWLEEDVNHQNHVVIHAQNEGLRDLFPKVAQGFRKGVGTAALVGASVFGGDSAVGAGSPSEIMPKGISPYLTQAHQEIGDNEWGQLPINQK